MLACTASNDGFKRERHSSSGLFPIVILWVQENLEDLAEVHERSRNDA